MVNDPRLEFAARTDTGRVRLQNEDCVAISPSHGFAVLADGMGGYSAGEVASSMAVEIVQAILERELPPWGTGDDGGANATSRSLERLLIDAIRTANAAIFEAAHAEPSQMGMGTTIVVAVLEPGTITIAYAGDSRAYRLRQGELLQLTRDHSLLQEQIDAGLIHPELARYAQNKNLVTRAVGVGADLDVDVATHDIWSGDIFLLCSDGLSDMLTENEMLALLTRDNASLKSACDSLVVHANQNGGYDNISVILLREESSAVNKNARLLGRIWNWIS